MKYLILGTMLLSACDQKRTKLQTNKVNLYDQVSRRQDSLIKRNDSIIKEQEKEIKLLKDRMKKH